MSNNDYLDNEKKPSDDGKESEAPQKKSLTFFFVALGCLVGGALLFGLAFAIPGAGTYMLFASMFSELACATFLNAQKRKYNFKWVMVTRIICYAIMVAAIAIVLLGISVAAK